MLAKFYKYTFSIPWNLFLITVGALIFGIGLKAIALPNGFITGGISGVALLLYYFSGKLSPGIWYFIINIPMFIFGWLYISKRFFFYSLYGMVALSLAMELITFQIPVRDPFLAILAGGTIMGAGAGITLRSLGSLGGNDIVAIILNQKLSIRMGSYYFAFNIILFTFSFGILKLEPVLYSLALIFVISYVLEYVLTMFNQRKMVMVISEKFNSIAKAIHEKLNRGATFLDGSGTYTGDRKKIILTVIHNYQLKRLEETVFTIDPDAFVITENTFNVLGRGFSRRKVY